MGTDMKQMYLDLNELLQDICQFLSGDTLQKLSAKDQNLAESLINRSKIQLQEISKIQTNQNIEEYMVMDKKDDDFTIRKTEVTIMDETMYPYVDLPAEETSKDIKFGYIFMKRRFLLGFEKMKRVYGSIHEGWLLIYFTDRDAKPIYTFNLKNYEAKECDGDKADFQLIRTMPQKKTYQFVAITRKDVKQWVTQINKCHDHTIMKYKMRVFENNENQLMDPKSSIQFGGSSDDEMADSIYEKLETYHDSERSTDNKTPRVRSTLTVKPPLLPERSTTNNKPTKPIKVSPPVIKNLPIQHSSDEDIGSYHEIEILGKDPGHESPKNLPRQYSSDEDLGSYHEIEILGKNPAHESLSNSTKSFNDSEDSSFSIDAEDSIYEQFSSVRNKVGGFKNSPTSRISSTIQNKQSYQDNNQVKVPSTSPNTNNNKTDTKTSPSVFLEPQPPSSHISHPGEEKSCLIDGSNHIMKSINSKKLLKRMVNSYSDESDEDSVYNNISSTVQNKIFDLRGSKSSEGKKEITALSTIPKLKCKPPVGLKPSITSPSTVKTRKH